ncbi:chromosome segregation protein SMC [Kineosporia sp. R_H_3]|uniref:chromosome segregation protein SMC n=1 Tax=Kineosporia sp. R_H_3 TaxID=1961848 RepID=UPI000B4B89B8|nr:chromosome segregation protein SMC [Kineosporia sp. R_H_3]
MHLKSLTLRGFKSFASATTLRFEPGITCVVGPNGSGKSNVVDALSWVMGEQGAKSLRGGKMEDVIFAGTSGRPPLGRAEVALTIDNTDGALPIDYAEVTISRTMFRSGGSDYAINGSPCRLLDIQELLSDSGIGREMHVIVGQGQLDAVLHASPEDRRAFIEEAAGVLKHRKRKEKALRKLDAMQANLTRVSDLTAEIRRQLKPLGRQAEVARRAQVVQADLRDARARILADDLVQLSTTLEAEVADETALRQRKEEVEAELVAGRERLAELEETAASAAPRLARAQETWYRLSSLRERIRGTASLAADRLRMLAEAEPERQPGRDPEELEAQARAVKEQEDALAEEVAAAREVLDTCVEARHDAEKAEGDEERRIVALQRAAADRREGLARLAGQVAARRSRVEAGDEELERLTTGIVEAEERAEAAQQEFTALESQVAGHEAGEQGLDAEHEAAAAALAEVEAEVEQLQQTDRDAERDRATWSARKEALELGLQRKDGAGALLAASDRLSGVLGSVAALLQVDSGYENAVAAALGVAADAVVVEDAGRADAALRLLKDDDAGRAAVLVAGAPRPAPGQRPALPAGARWVRDLVHTPAALEGAVDRLLADTAVVPDLDVARAFVDAHPGTSAVTFAGDVVTVGLLQGGSASAPSLLEVQAAVDEAADKVADAVRRAEQARFALAGATARRDAAVERVEAALDRLHESDARLSAVAEQLGHLGSTARAARAEADRQRKAVVAKQEALAADREALAELEERLEVAQESTDDEEPSTQDRDRLAAAATAARSAEMEARLALRTCEERARALSGRADSLLKAAAAEREARARAVAREERRRKQAVTARAVLAGAEYALGLLDSSLTRADQLRLAADEERRTRERELQQCRGHVGRLAEEQSRLLDSVHRDEVARAEQRARIENLRQRAVDELGIEADILVEEYGPHQPVPPSPLAPGEPEPAEPPLPAPFDRAQQEKRLKAAERALALLGTVNPLALEEFAALEERHKFLTEQLEDLKASRRDLLDIVKEVDERVEQVFTEAYHDTAREFEGVFSRLFPGGDGRLVLTDPSDMLTTGIEVEARPPGKKVKRLSLLSGGERSLTAVALLVAIFKARPSPFYVMDEVEAALDDTNLGRLITIFEELRESSQLIVITHQKRTMEVADALYGVTMRGDGVTTVISQRLREEQPA